MSSLIEARQAIGLWKIRHLKEHPATSGIVAYSKATKIGVLMPVNNQADVVWAESLKAGFLAEGKGWGFLGFSNLLPAEAPKSELAILNRNDLQWNFIPKTDKCKPFLSQHYDILINLCTEMCIPLAYISAISKSSFKIGKYHPKLAGCYDFMLESREATAKGLLAEIRHYLYTIK